MWLPLRWDVKTCWLQAVNSYPQSSCTNAGQHIVQHTLSNTLSCPLSGLRNELSVFKLNAKTSRPLRMHELLHARADNTLIALAQTTSAKHVERESARKLNSSLALKKFIPPSCSPFSASDTPSETLHRSTAANHGQATGDPGSGHGHGHRKQRVTSACPASGAEQPVLRSGLAQPGPAAQWQQHAQTPLALATDPESGVAPRSCTHTKAPLASFLMLPTSTSAPVHQAMRNTRMWCTGMTRTLPRLHARVSALMSHVLTLTLHATAG